MLDRIERGTISSPTEELVLADIFDTGKRTSEIIKQELGGK